MKYYSSACFPSRNTTKIVEIHLPPMRDVTIEQPHQTIDWNVWGAVQQEIADLYLFVVEKENWHIMN